MADSEARGAAKRRRGAASPADPASGELELIRISADPTAAGPRFRGHVDEIGPEKVAGWVFDARAQGKPNSVELLLDGFGVARADTGLERGDVDKLSHARLRSGFLMDLREGGVQDTAALVLARALARAKAREQSEEDIRLDAQLIASPDLSDGRPALEATPIFPLPAGFSAKRSLAQWAEFFDLDLERLRADAEHLAAPPGLSPPPPESAADVARFIAFYLPQFHAIPENDAWWGPGFTEWTGVSTLTKQFEKHQAPNLPADLGFYDLLSKDTRRKQGELAKQYGVYGFCYYFYWFSGRRILERPLELMLRERAPDMPFCLCWANEPWSRRWDGSEQDVLIAQHHDAEEDLAILDDLAPYFEDDRYIRIDGKPLLIIYRMSLMPEPMTFVMRLREAAAERGLGELFICNVMSFGDTDPSRFGCDASVEFPPHNAPAREAKYAELGVPPTFTGKIYDYASAVELSVGAERPFAHFPGVMPRWDNTARKGAAGHVYAHSSPELFEAWLRAAAKRALAQRREAPLVFINSWNEWGEGAHIEPDRATGRRYLEAVRRVASADPRAGLAEAPDPALLQALITENQLLSRRLAELDQLSAPEPVTPGYPDSLTHAEHDANGAAHIDMVNVQNGRLAFTAARNQALRVRGWCFTRTASEEAGFVYLILSNAQSRKSYFAMVSSFSPREDVAAAHGIELERARGFDVRLDCALVEPGSYVMRVIEARGPAASHLDTGARLILT